MKRFVLAHKIGLSDKLFEVNEQNFSPRSANKAETKKVLFSCFNLM